MSIATRITSIEEHIGNAYDKLDDLGINLTDVDKNIDNIATVLEEYYDNQPKVTGEGTEVTLEGTKVGKIGIDIEGNSTQETTEGKQLFDGQLENGQLSSSTGEPEGSQTDRKRTVNFVDVSNLSSVTLSFEVTSTASAYGRFFLYDENKAFISNTQIASTTKTVDVSNASYVKWWGSTIIKENTIMLNNGSTALPYEEYTGGIPSPNPQYPQPILSAGDNVNLFDKDNANIINAYINNGTITEASNGKSLYIACKPNTTYTISRTVGTRFRAVTTTVVPAVGVSGNDYIGSDTASSITITTGANAQYLCVNYYNRNTDGADEQKILNSIKIEQGSTATPYSPYNMGCVTEKIVNKNLFDGEHPIYVDKKILNDNGVEINDTSGGYTKMYIPVHPNATYTISGLGSSGTKRMYFFDINKVFISRSAGFGASSTFTTPANCYFIDIQYFYTGNDFSTYQLEQGSTATDYVAHQEQNFIIPCQQPMRDKGTVKDLFIKIAGNWFERHYIGKYKFTGNETISITNSGGSNWFYAISIPSILMNGDGVASNSRCTHYKAARIATSSTEEGYYFVSDTKTMRIRFGTEDTVANYKAWLANNDVQFEYISKNYTDLPCTEEQTTVLEALAKAKSYEDTTIIYSEDITPAYLNATALKK